MTGTTPIHWAIAETWGVVHLACGELTHGLGQWSPDKRLVTCEACKAYELPTVQSESEDKG